MAPRQGQAAPRDMIETQPKKTQAKLLRTDREISDSISVPDGVRCTVQAGFVTLEGTVEWRSQRNNLEACARKLPGVRGVMNNLVVKPGAGDAVSSAVA